MRFLWTALILAVGASAGFIAITNLLGQQHISTGALGFVVAFVIFTAVVDHLSNKADAITNAIRSVQAVVEETQESEDLE